MRNVNPSIKKDWRIWRQVIIPVSTGAIYGAERATEVDVGEIACEIVKLFAERKVSVCDVDRINKTVRIADRR